MTLVQSQARRRFSKFGILLWSLEADFLVDGKWFIRKVKIINRNSTADRMLCTVDPSPCTVDSLMSSGPQLCGIDYWAHKALSNFGQNKKFQVNRVQVAHLVLSSLKPHLFRDRRPAPFTIQLNLYTQPLLVSYYSGWRICSNIIS